MSSIIDRRIEDYVQARLRGNPHAQRFSAPQVREEIREYLAYLEDDISRNKARPPLSHWNLTMLDDVRDRAACVVMFFDEAGLALLAGQSTSDQVKTYCEQSRYPSVTRAMKELPDLLGVTGEFLRLSQKEAAEWLGRPVKLSEA